jgi:hypothetical protein
VGTLLATVLLIYCAYLNLQVHLEIHTEHGYYSLVEYRLMMVFLLASTTSASLGTCAGETSCKVRGTNALFMLKIQLQHGSAYQHCYG